MKIYKNNETIEVMGVPFRGVDEMIEVAESGQPKDGVYVAIHCENYPCFDSSDALYEDRRYTNIVFARSLNELTNKMLVLKRLKPRANYDKLTSQLHPMAYWGGDKIYDVYMTEADDEDPYSVAQEDKC